MPAAAATLDTPSFLRYDANMAVKPLSGSTAIDISFSIAYYFVFIVERRNLQKIIFTALNMGNLEVAFIQTVFYFFFKAGFG